MGGKEAQARFSEDTLLTGRTALGRYSQKLSRYKLAKANSQNLLTIAIQPFPVNLLRSAKDEN